MSQPEIDPNTAASMLEDADFADEHTKPPYSDDSVPTGDGGDGGMDVHQNKPSE